MSLESPTKHNDCICAVTVASRSYTVVDAFLCGTRDSSVMRNVFLDSKKTSNENISDYCLFCFLKVSGVCIVSSF